MHNSYVSIHLLMLASHTFDYNTYYWMYLISIGPFIELLIITNNIIN